MIKRQWTRIVLVMAAACSGAAHPAEPADWFLASQQGPDGARRFTVELDSTVAYDGASSGFIRSNSTGVQVVANLTCKPSLSSQKQLPPNEWNECVGTHTYENANVYHGEFRHGDRDGFGILEIEFMGDSSDNCIGWNEPAVYVGSFKGGRLNGHGVLIAKSGAKYTGTFKDNIAQSDLTQKGCSGASSAGWSNCVGVYRFPNGNVYLGEFADGRPGGIGMLQVRGPVPSVYVGEFDGGSPSGRGAVSMHDTVYSLALSGE